MRKKGKKHQGHVSGQPWRALLLTSGRMRKNLGPEAGPSFPADVMTTSSLPAELPAGVAHCTCDDDKTVAMVRVAVAVTRSVTPPKRQATGAPSGTKPGLVLRVWVEGLGLRI